MDTIHLILFTRAPVAGKTKSRLAATLGDDAAKDLHVCCLRDLVDTCDRFRTQWEGGGGGKQGEEEGARDGEQTGELQTHVFITPPGSEADFAAEGVSWGGDVLVHAQAGESLGERMANAFAEVLQDEPENARAVLVGADLPLIDERHLHQALGALTTADVVFGGTDDGGYYLVGTRGLRPRVFELKRWKEGEVLRDSLALGGARGFSTATIDTLPDVDTAEDLALVRAHPLFEELASRRAVRFIAGLPE